MPRITFGRFRPTGMPFKFSELIQQIRAIFQSLVLIFIIDNCFNLLLFGVGEGNVNGHMFPLSLKVLLQINHLKRVCQ